VKGHDRTLLALAAVFLVAGLFTSRPAMAATHHHSRSVAPTSATPFFSFLSLFAPRSGGVALSSFQGNVDAAAMAAGVPTGIARAVIRSESGYNPRAVSRSGALGLGQILCSTARGIGFSGSCRDLRDPDVNLRYSMAYLRMAIDRGGSGCAGISLYNRGIAARPVCTGYGRMVLARVARE
jgi:soluble lytic murein transglycosylase-like protein